MEAIEERTLTKPFRGALVEPFQGTRVETLKGALIDPLKRNPSLIIHAPTLNPYSSPYRPP